MLDACCVRCAHREGFYVRGWSTSSDRYFCYHIVVGSYANQDVQDHGSNALCEERFRISYHMGDFSRAADAVQYYDGGSFSYGCRTSDRLREAELRMRLDPNAAELTATVAEYSPCTYLIELIGTALMLRLPPALPPPPPLPPSPSFPSPSPPPLPRPGLPPRSPRGWRGI